MVTQERDAHSYRADPEVPDFPDDRPLVIFDAECVLCSGFARFVLSHDRQKRYRFAAAQGPLGQALFRHYRLDPVDFETNLIIEDGIAAGRLEAFAQIVGGLGGVWRAARLVLVLPRPLRDFLYDRIARNRYAIFGRYDACWRPPQDWRDRFLD